PGPMGKEVPNRSVIKVPVSFDLTSEPRFAIRYIDVCTSYSKAGKYQKQGITDSVYYYQKARHEASRWGRHLRLGTKFYLRTSHAWWKWVPAKEPNRFTPKAYGEKHPEYYALVNGKRQNFYGKNHHGGQLNVSDPNVAKVYANNIIAYAKK